MSVPVRIPDRLHQRIEELATSERRSVANMVAVLLEQALEDGGHELVVRDTADNVVARVPVPTKPAEADDHFRPDFGSKLGTS